MAEILDQGYKNVWLSKPIAAADVDDVTASGIDLAPAPDAGSVTIAGKDIPVFDLKGQCEFIRFADRSTSQVVTTVDANTRREIRRQTAPEWMSEWLMDGDADGVKGVIWDNHTGARYLRVVWANDATTTAIVQFFDVEQIQPEEIRGAIRISARIANTGRTAPLRS